MKKLSHLLFMGLVLFAHTLITVILVSCISGMVLLKLMQEENINRYLCLGISIGVALVSYLHVRYGSIIIEKILKRKQEEIKRKIEE